MCVGINLKDLHNDTLDGIYNFYFEPDSSTAYQISESQKLSNITFLIVIFVLIVFVVILQMVFRIVTKGQDIPTVDAIMMDRVQRLRHEMNNSLLRAPDDQNLQYRMRNNQTPNKTLMARGPLYEQFELLNQGSNGV